MSVWSFEQCDCDCHKFPEGTVMHCMPCCNQCPECGMHVKFPYFEEHMKRHEEERAELERLIAESEPKVTLVIGDKIE